MKLLAVVLLLLPLSGCLAAVVDDFTVNCPQFFITVDNKVTPPTVFTDNNNERFKQICQTLNNVVEFATLYDTENRIPVYSAYIFEGLMGCARLDKWHIEPQLDDPQQGGNMEVESAVRPRRGDNQALNEDYTNSGYHRGHLAPVFHAKSKSCADATFTLTNAAPQHGSFNSGGWRATEGRMGRILDAYCIKKHLKVYVVTGVVPGDTNMNNRVRVPSHYWMAFCCIDQNNKAVHSGGYMGENTGDKDKKVERMLVDDLEETITDLYKQRHHVFDRFILFGETCYTGNEEMISKKKRTFLTKRKNMKRKCLPKGKHKLVGKNKN